MITSEIRSMNDYLARTYGWFDGINPNWRIVWSEDEFEKRKSNYTPEGIELNYSAVFEFRKYPQARNRYILERCLAVPEQFYENNLLQKFSYEPLWTFQDRYENPLPPKLDVCIVVIDQVYRAAAASIGAKYKDPEVFDEKDAPEARKAKIDKLVADLFGNETLVTDSLRYGEAVVMPSNYEKPTEVPASTSIDKEKVN